MNFAGLLEFHARSDPLALAVADSRCRLDYGDLDALASRFGSAALAAGLTRGDRVAILLPNRVEEVIALLGAMKAGLLPVPLNWRLQGTDLARVIDHAAPALIVTQDDRLAEVGDGAGRIVVSAGQSARAGSFWQFVASGDPGLGAIGRQGRDIANLMYTSGTTSTPKAAIHTHAMRLAIAGAMADGFRLSRRDVALAVSPLFHTSGMSVLSNALFSGCPCILMEKWDLARFLQLLGQKGVTFLHLISTLMVDIATADRALFDGLQSRVRMTWGGGHSIDPSLLEEYERRIGGTFVQGYARTEGGLSYNSVDRERRSFAHHGFANENSSEMGIFDPATGLRCPDGTTGEIAVRGDGVSPGYWDGPMIRVPPSFDGGWQRTGDLGFIGADGALRFLGRTDQMIKTGGENVYPSEVETALLRIPGVANAAVFGVPDPRWGQKVAAVVVRSAPELTETDIDREIRRDLAGFKVPRLIAFVGDLPRLGNQKVDLRRCREMVLDGATPAQVQQA